MKKVIIGILAMTCLLCGTGQIVASAAENSDISGLTGNFTVDSNGSTDSPDKIRVTVTLWLIILYYQNQILDYDLIPHHTM